jgi:Sulfatase
VVTALVLGAAALVAGALALAGVWRGGDGEATAGYAPDAKGRPPVVVLILDEFPTDDLLRPDGGIDARRFPNFARLAKISTWFPNAFTVYDSTFKAVPAILDARLPVKFSKPDVRSHQPSIYHLMHRLGYEIHKVESATAVCPPRICKGSRPRRPSVLDRLKGSGRAPRLHKWIGAIQRRERPGFYLHHALFPHEPWIYLPSGLPNRPYGEDPIEGINTKPSFNDTDLSQHNHMRHLLQVGYTDRELGRLLDRLRRTRLLRRSLLAVVADHGYAYDIGVPSRRFVTESNVDEIGPVPLFIKAPGQMRGRVDDSMVRNIDVVPTIGDMLGRSIWWPHDGDSVFSPESKERDELVMTTRDFKREVRIDDDELAERRAANRARWARLFGTSAYSERAFGDPWASVYRIGPNKQLLGRRLARLDLGGSVATALHAARDTDASGERVRARIANVGLLDEVTPDAVIRPTRVTGRLVNGSRTGTRELALVVNGRIRSVGRSFHLSRRQAEFFSFVFPERALRRGRNHVELLEVVDGGRSFVPLGGNHGAGR